MSEIQPTPSSPGFEVGDQVRHPKFGLGTILYKSGEGDGLKLDVMFAEEGQKKLLVKYAGLKKVSYVSPDDENEAEGESPGDSKPE